MDFGDLKDIVKDLTQSADKRAVSKAQKLFAKGQVDKAIEALKEGHAASPESNEILFEMARVLTFANRAGEAADALRTILRRNPRALQRVNEMLEEVRARHQSVGPLYDAVAEHFIRQDDLKSALAAMERMKAEEIGMFIGRHRGKWDQVRKNAPDAKMAKVSLHSAYYLALSHEVVREYPLAGEIYRIVARNNPDEIGKILPRLEGLLAKDYQNVALRLEVADLMLRAGRTDLAVQQFNVALETDKRVAADIAGRIRSSLQGGKETPELRFLLASALLGAGDHPGAVETLRPLVQAGALLDQTILALQPLATGEKSGAARGLLASALLRRGQAQSALELLVQTSEDEGPASVKGPLEELVAATPNLPRAHLMLSDIYLAEGHADKAVGSMRRARELAPNEGSLMIPRLTKILEGHSRSAEAHLLLADLVLQGGEPERGIVVLRHLVRDAPEGAGEALSRFTNILKDDPNSPRARIGAAETCLELQQFQESIDHFAAVAAARPELTAEFLHPLLLLSEAAREQSPRIVQVLRELEPRSPLPQAVRFAIGEAAFHGGDLSAAATAFREVLEAAPERAEEVRQALERFDRDDPRATEVRYVLASIYLDRRDHAAAAAELSRGGSVSAALLEKVLGKYEELLAASPDDTEARVGYVGALLLARRFDQVLTVGQETLRGRDDETTAPITLAMGDALLEKGDPAGAVKRYYAAFGRNRALVGSVVDRLRRTIQTEGSHALASLALGKVLGAAGRVSEAVEALRAANATDPKLRDTVLTELKELQINCPGDPQAGLLVLALLREGRETHEALKTISALLDTHPDLAPTLIETLEDILKAEPTQAFAQFELARAFQRLGNYPKSAATYLSAFRQDSGLATMIMKRLYECMDAAPTSPEAYLAACAIHAARGKFLSATETIQKAFLKMPGEIDRLLPRLEEIWKQNRTAPQIALVFAQACLKAGKFDKALAGYSDAALKDASLYDAAYEGFEVIVSSAPKMGEAYLARGKAHAQRMRVDQALSDFDRAARLTPALLPAIVEEAERFRKRLPDSYPCAILLADLYLAGGRDGEAMRLLKEEIEKGWGKAERLSILVRLWRLASAIHDDEAARGYLEEAGKLTPDRGQFLARVHAVHLATLRAQAARFKERAASGSRRAADLQIALRAIVDLGDLEEAQSLLDRFSGGLDHDEAARLRAEIALRRGDYARATEQLKAIGPSRALAFGAARSGDYALAAQTLEALATSSGDPGFEVALRRVYVHLVESDLLGGCRPLQAETTLSFDTGAAA